MPMAIKIGKHVEPHNFLESSLHPHNQDILADFIAFLSNGYPPSLPITFLQTKPNKMARTSFMIRAIN